MSNLKCSMYYNFNLTAFIKAYDVKRGIKNVFTADNGLRCAVTLDIWPSNSQCSYLGVTCHFIDAKFNYKREAIALPRSQLNCDLMWD